MRRLLATLPLALTLACASEPPPAPTAPSSATPSTPTTSGDVAHPPVGATGPIPTGNAVTNAPPEKTAAAPAATAAEVTVGQAAPDFSSSDQDGKPVHLADLKGHPVVVYFYPKDETPGCTHEACSFRDAWSDLQKKGVVIIGISTDTAESHKKFAANHKLPFLLVSDPKGEIAAKYGVPVEGEYIKRQSFVVAPDGTVKKIYRTVDVKVHAHEIAMDTAK